jgi:hypothetical protein
LDPHVNPDLKNKKQENVFSVKIPLVFLTSMLATMDDSWKIKKKKGKRRGFVTDK